jgi:hypothetical protein
MNAHVAMNRTEPPGIAVGNAALAQRLPALDDTARAR